MKRLPSIIRIIQITPDGERDLGKFDRFEPNNRAELFDTLMDFASPILPEHRQPAGVYLLRWIDVAINDFNQIETDVVDSCHVIIGKDGRSNIDCTTRSFSRSFLLTLADEADDDFDELVVA